MDVNWLEFYIAGLKRWVDVWESDISHTTPVIRDTAIYMTRMYDRSELPDWVIILAEGNPEHMADVIGVAREDMKEETDAEHFNLSKI